MYIYIHTCVYYDYYYFVCWGDGVWFWVPSVFPITINPRKYICFFALATGQPSLGYENGEILPKT